MTTASYASMSILERCFLNPGFWKRGQRIGLRCYVLNGESADVPEYIVVDWSLRYLRCAMAIGTPESHFQCGRHCYALPYVCVPDCYIGPNSQVPRGRPSLLYDHTNVILRVVV